MASIQWIANSLYPAGYYVRDFRAGVVIVPAGWKVATALRPSGQAGNRIDYPVTATKSCWTRRSSPERITAASADR